MQDVDMTEYIKQAEHVYNMFMEKEEKEQFEKYPGIKNWKIQKIADRLYEDSFNKYGVENKITNLETVESLKNIVKCTEVECIYSIKENTKVGIGADLEEIEEVIK